jgi:hypothetical protein
MQTTGHEKTKPIARRQSGKADGGACGTKPIWLEQAGDWRRQTGGDWAGDFAEQSQFGGGALGIADFRLQIADWKAEEGLQRQAFKTKPNSGGQEATGGIPQNKANSGPLGMIRKIERKGIIRGIVSVRGHESRSMA